jgi:hypothetical protein
MWIYTSTFPYAFMVYYFPLTHQSQFSMPAGIATGWTVGDRFPAGERDFSLLHSVQTGSGNHLASYPMGAGGSFPWSKVAGA